MSNDLSPPEEQTFSQIAILIQERRARAVQAVNTELIELYWEIGKIISAKLEASEWGDKAINDLARYLKKSEPSLRGFSRRNLYRMIGNFPNLPQPRNCVSTADTIIMDPQSLDYFPDEKCH